MVNTKCKLGVVPVLSILVLVGCIRGLVESLYLIANYQLETHFHDTAFLFAILCGVSAGIFVFWGVVVLTLQKIRSGRVGFWIWSITFLLGFVTTDLYGLISRPPQWAVEHQVTTPKRIAEPHTSVILITMDTVRADHLPMYGYPRATAPFLNKLARYGTLFSECYATCPATTPSHASLLTGLEPTQHGSRFNAVPVKTTVQTIAERFRDQGYKTAAFISAFPVFSRVSGLDKGFDYYNEYLVPDRGPQLAYLSHIFRPFMQLGVLRPAERKAHRTLEHAKAWLASHGDRAYFLWCHFYDPHLPYDAPRPFDRLFTAMHQPFPIVDVFTIQNINEKALPPSLVNHEVLIAQYDGEIAFLDRMIEQLVYKARDMIGSNQLRLIVTADHGESLTEHDYYFSHSRDLYQPSMAIPLIQYNPQERQQRVSNTPMNNNETLPLLLHSLLPQTLDENAAKPIEINEKFEQLLHGENAEGVYIAAHQPLAENIIKKKRSIISLPWKCIFTPGASVELYNLEHDPGELVNEAKNQPELTNMLIRVIEQKMAQTADSQTTELDADIIEQLRTLGYISSQ